ncbi:MULTISPECIES: hypothetical protein [Clostridium]|uniref:hypothetical protein n=1 Tax=Clostridium TaxID=1485 RepID=UPI00069D1962|nr:MULTISPECIES: hypothetical protein [Clostridium]KOF55782.1 hypothetical protein AGR56_18465 [Clostridium sp. DMHC 10]MCD2348829.1 hypothetical protein [Clostridium guangxiense]
MRYFTDELWEEINCGVKERREIAEKKWDKNAEEYRAVFNNIRYRFSKKFLKIYEKEANFHDYKLKEIKINHDKYGFKDPVKISLIINNEINTWQMDYTKIKKISLNYNKIGDILSRNKEFYVGFDDLSYDEFLEVDDKTLSHEILFASGATLLIKFEKLFIKKLSINKD